MSITHRTVSAFAPLLLTVSLAHTQERHFDISQMGAVGDGATINTAAIQAVIDQTAEAGGGNGGFNPDAPQDEILPRLVAIQNAANVVVEDVHLLNQSSWVLFVLYSNDVIIRNVNIRAERYIPSSDGIDIDSSRNVLISNVDIDVNDDCIAIKSGKDEDGRRVGRPAENIVVENSIFRYGHGGVSMGSEMSGGIRNVEIRDTVITEGNWAPIRFKTQPSRGGIVEDITYRNIELQNTLKAFEFNMAWRMVNPKPPSDPLPIVRNINIINVFGSVENVGDMTGLGGSPISNVRFENTDIKASETGLILRDLVDLDLDGLTIEVPDGVEPIVYRLEAERIE